MNPAIEVAVTRKHCGSVQIALDHLFLDDRIQRAAHAVTGGAGKGHHAETQLLQLAEQIGFFQVHLHRLGAGRERGLDPGLAQQAEFVGITRNQTRRNHVAWVTGVGAAGDGGNDHRAIGHLALFVLYRAADATRGQLGSRQQRMGIGRTRHGARHTGQVELEHPLVFGILQAVSPETGLLGILLDQLDLIVLAAGQFQIVDGLFIDIEHGRGRTVFGRHVRDGRAVANGQAAGTLAVKFQIGTHYPLLAQEGSQGQYQIGAGNAGLELAGQLDTDDVGQAHPGGATEHDALRFKTANTHRDHAERIHHRGVAVGAHTGIRESHTVGDLHNWRHLLQVDLVHDAITRRDHIDVLERRLGPVDKVKAIVIAAVFDGAVLLEGIGLETGMLDCQRVVDDQLGRHHRVDLGRVAALLGDCIT